MAGITVNVFLDSRMRLAGTVLFFTLYMPFNIVTAVEGTSKARDAGMPRLRKIVVRMPLDAVFLPHAVFCRFGGGGARTLTLKP